MISFRLVLLIKVAMLSLWIPVGRSSAVFSEDRLTPLDFMREEAANVSRVGIVDQVTYDNEMFGFCHIAIYQAFTRLVKETRQPFDIENAFIAVSAVYLAIDMLNKGDGSVIKEIEGLNERCPIRFTGESFDSALSQAGTLEQTLEVLDRTTPKQREVCAFLGAAWSPVTIVMAMVTGLYGRPQLSAISMATQLDDKVRMNAFGWLNDLFTVFTISTYIQLHNFAPASLSQHSLCLVDSLPATPEILTHSSSTSSKRMFNILESFWARINWEVRLYRAF